MRVGDDKDPLPLRQGIIGHGERHIGPLRPTGISQHGPIGAGQQARGREVALSAIGLALLLGITFNMGYLGFWLGDAIAGFTPFFIGGAFYLSGKWKTNKYVIKK